MPTLTLDVPDELAERLAQRCHQLPQLLAMALEFCAAEPSLVVPVSHTTHPVFEEMIDFLASGPTPEQIVAFKISPAVQGRLLELLDNNCEERLTEEEAAELDVYEQVNHLLLLLKARARLAASPPH